jgi:hypothetical protein
MRNVGMSECRNVGRSKKRERKRGNREGAEGAKGGESERCPVLRLMGYEGQAE